MTAQPFLLILGGIGGTLTVTVAAFLFGCMGGALIATMQESRWRLLRAIAAVYVQIIRGVPPLVWLFIAFFGLTQFNVRLEPLAAAVLTLSLIAAAYLAEIFRGGLAAIPLGQFEAASALGFNRVSTFRFVTLPLVVRAAGPTTTTYAIGLLKDSALASTIGVSEVFHEAIKAGALYGQVLVFLLFAGAIYLALGLPLAALSRLLDRSLRRRYSL
jgi:His/Glu/Gln/Arg/opine family amino acid ABC transporter permease subunit